MAHKNCCRPPCNPPYCGLEKDCCVRCRRLVYFNERKEWMGKVWHTFCFSCRKCRKLLGVCSANFHKCDIYCNACYCAETTCPMCRPCCDPIVPFCPNPCDIAEFCCDEQHHQQPKGPCCTSCADGGCSGCGGARGRPQPRRARPCCIPPRSCCPPPRKCTPLQTCSTRNECDECGATLQ